MLNFAMYLKPLPGKLVAKPLQAVRKTSKGLIIPDLLQAPVAEAIVMWTAGNTEVSEGDRVLYLKSTGLSYRLLDLEVVVLKSVDVLAVVCDE
ncbi:MAG: hypothetical protein P3M74_00100 [Candidatus Hodgkinia cicadicola]|nr:MAG: hypothetical protein P3M74_00100 [Candidatus Hodgkinia cicadicola]